MYVFYKERRPNEDSFPKGQTSQIANPEFKTVITPTG